MKRFEEREHVIIENEGQKIFGIMHRPLHAPHAPAVLMCHGFAGNKIGRYRIYVQLAQQLARVGIATLRFDFRGSGESEGEFSEMTIDTEVSDALKGLEWLRKQPHIDAKRIGMLGNSFGGAIAVLAAERDGRIMSLALLAALFNSVQWRRKWEAFLSNTADESAQKEMARLLDGNAPGAGFYKSFMTLNVEPCLHSLKNVPLLHIHSESDTRVGLDQADHYKRCREAASAETKWIRLQKSDHDFSSSDERILLVDQVVDWFTKTLT